MKAAPIKRNMLQLFATYLRPQWQRALILAVLLLGSIGLQLYSPQIIRNFIDAAIINAPLSSLTGMAILFLIVALVSQAISLAATALSGQVAWQATNELRADLLAHCLKLDMPFHNSRTPGELIERVDGDIGTLSDFFSKLVIQVFGSILLAAGVLIVLFFEDWRIGLALSSFVLLAVIVLSRIREIAVPSNAADRQSRAVMFSLIEERIAGLDDIRANGGGHYVMRRMQQVMHDMLVKARWALTVGSTMWVTMITLFALGFALALGVGMHLYTLGLITVGTVFLFVQYAQLLRTPLENFSDQLKAFQQALASIDRIQSLFALQAVVKDGEGAEVPSGPLLIEFDNVSFAYNDATPDAQGQDADDNSTQPVLKNLNLTFQPGEVVGLLGRTGSGKTTIMRLLLRLYDVTEGSLRLGGVDVRKPTFEQLRSRIGVVTQDVQLFQASVRDNLTLFDDSIPDDKIIAIIEEIGLASWIRSMPNGLDSMLAHGNGGLSAGEAQLLAFARVFLRDPGLVILDEASSRLDPATERLIEQAIDRLLHNRTAIIIAHRLGTVQRADTIVILDGGEVHEHGKRTDLLADQNSHFAQLMRTGMEDVLS
jgi:ATP-binding cassette subfamily B protein